jgi:hypothetical protein
MGQVSKTVDSWGENTIFALNNALGREVFDDIPNQAGKVTVEDVVEIAPFLQPQ